MQWAMKKELRSNGSLYSLIALSLRLQFPILKKTSFYTPILVIFRLIKQFPHQGGKEEGVQDELVRILSVAVSISLQFSPEKDEFLDTHIGYV